MKTALITALEERIREGYSKASVIEEMVAVGYTEAEALDAYATAHAHVARTTVPASAGAALPPLGAFVGSAWDLSKHELALLGKAVVMGVGTFVAVSIAVFVIAETFGFSVEGSFLMTTVIVPLVAMLIGALISFALTRALLLRTASVRFSDHIVYAFRHFFSLVLVTLYVTIITQVGYALFIIPGILAAVYLLFAIPRVLTHESRGLMALTESVALVYGRFFPVLARFVVMNLVLIVFFLVVAVIVVGLAYGVFWFTPHESLVGVPLLISAFIAIAIASAYWLTCGLVVLYETLERVPAPALPGARTITQIRTLFAVVIGLVIFAMVAIAFCAGFAGYALFNW